MTIREQILTKIPAPERRLHLAGIPTAILEGGEGPPLVLLHGQGEFGATWMRVLPDLVAAHRVVVPDLPGHGATGVGERTLDRRLVDAWLGELISHTCASAPVVAGHLLGGAIAARFGVDHGDRLERLVLVDTLGLRWYRPAGPFAVALAGFLARPTERSRDRLFEQCFADLDGVRNQMDGDMELLEAYALECARRPQQGGALRALMPRLGMPPIPANDLAGLRVPTALIWGRDDRQTPLRTAETAAARYGWELHVIEGSADDPAHEQPAEFLRALRHSLRSTSATSEQRSPR